MNGQFISFEGIDGAGKSSHVDWVADILRQAGNTVLCTREPGGTPVGEQLRGMPLSEQMDIDTELLLMFAARRQHLVEVIEPALARNLTVISDRFHDSSFAFQGGGRGVSLDRIAQLDGWVGGPRPDLTFYFDLPVDVAMSRIAGTRALDRFENEQRDFHERVRAVYCARAELEPGRIQVIDANRSIEDIRKDLAAAICDRGNHSHE